MIDADIAGDAGADGEFTLDVAAGWHGEILGKQRLADFAIPVGSARSTQQRAVLAPAAELLRRDKAAFPEPLAVVPGAGFVHLEAPRRGGFDIQRETLADQQLAQTGGLALELAHANVPFLVGEVRAQIITADLAGADQLGELV